MPKEVEIPGYGPVEFPDSMSDDEIASVIRTKFSEGTTNDLDVPAVTPEQQVAQAGEEARQSALSIPGVPDDAPASTLDQYLPERGRMATIAAGAMSGAEVARRATQGVPHRGVALGAQAVGGMIGAAAGSLTNDMIRGTPTQESVLNAVREGSLDAAFGLGVPAVAQGLRGLGPYAARALGINPEQAKALNDTAELIGAEYGIVDASTRAPIKGARTVLGVFPYVGTPFRRSGAESRQAIVSEVERRLNAVAPNATLSSIGVDMVEGAKGAHREWKVVADSLYENFYQFAGESGATVPSAGIINAAEEASRRMNTPRLTEGAVRDTRGGEVTGYLQDLTRIADENISVTELRGIQEGLSELASKPELTAKDLRRIMIVKRATEDALSQLNAPQDVKDELIGMLSTANGWYSAGMQQFSTATAKKFGRVDKNLFDSGAFRASTLEPDEVARAAFNLRSPEAIRNLKSIVGDDAVRAAARNHIETAYERATSVSEEGVPLLNFNMLERSLGLNNPNISQEALAESLRGTGVTLGDWKRLIEYGKSLGDIPMASKFVARRATIGGAGSAVRALTGTALLGGVAGGGTGVAGAITSLVLARKGADILTSPKYLKTVLRMADPQISTSGRSTQAVRLLNMLFSEPENYVEQESQN